jgi:electron transfer flavoprotein alpha/beta subunit
VSEAANACSVVALLEDERDLGVVPIARTLGAVTAIAATAPASRPRAEAALRQALAAGAERAVLVVDPALEAVDYLAIAHVLACAIRRMCEAAPEGAVVIFAGDRGRGAVGPAVAERLSMPHLAGVVAVERRDAEVRVTRHRGHELRTYHGVPPVLLACTLGATPSEAAASSDAAITALDLTALQVSVHELQHRRHFRPSAGVGPSPRPHVVASVEVLSERLARDGLWPLPREGKKTDAKSR